MGVSGGSFEPWPGPYRSSRYSMVCRPGIESGHGETRRHFSENLAAAGGPTHGSPGNGGPSWSRHLPPWRNGCSFRTVRPLAPGHLQGPIQTFTQCGPPPFSGTDPVSYTHLRAHETVLD